MEYNLSRYIEAQSDIYERVLKELKQGKKTSHWMWYIFPQIQGLGYSPTAQFYAIKSIGEAAEYLNNRVLGSRLIKCCQILLNLENYTAEDIFGSVDAMKLKSSMTLFSLVSDNPVFNQVLGMYYNGEKDNATYSLIKIHN